MSDGPDPGYVEHPRIRPESLEARTYQGVIAAAATDKNTLCVLPTGLGKTAVAILLAAQRLETADAEKILMMAPTRPLVEQHRESFERALEVPTEVYEVMTGDTRPEKRAEAWKEVGCFFATPQVVENDVINGRIDLSEFALVVFDEVHRATGEYPYNFIAEQYVNEPEARVLGLTASPGGDREQIESVAENLAIEHFEIRTEDDPDVAPYIQETAVQWVDVELTDNFRRIQRHLEAAQRPHLKKLKSMGFLSSISNVRKTDLLKLRGEVGRKMKQSDDPDLYSAMSHVAACMKVQHALELLESQGIKPLYNFFEKMKKDQSTKAARSLLNSDEFNHAISVTEWMHRNEKEHPKLEKLEELLGKKLANGENAIVFTQFRDTVDLLVERLGALDGIDPQAFKGQKDDFTQKKQLQILDDFRNDQFNVLVSTSVGEEGLDIPAVDYVFFYEPVPSEVRTIQRRGRTGRQEKGAVYVLKAKNTRDEGYYWSAKNKEQKMKQVMAELKEHGLGGEPEPQATLDGFAGDDEDDAEVDSEEPPASETAEPGDSTEETTTTDSRPADDAGAESTPEPDVDSGEEVNQGDDGDEDEEVDIPEADPEADRFADGEVVIYADDRENTVMKTLARKEMGVRSERLEVGDFLVSDRVVVERKRVDDFVTSMIDNRLFGQLTEMKQQFPRAVMILEGDGLYAHRNIHPNAIRGALSSVAIDYGIPVLWSDDEDETAELLISLAKREQQDNDRSITVRGERSPQTEAELQKYLVAGLPNVSDTLAERLLETFGTVTDVFTADEDALKTVDGIGPEKAARIKEILTRDFDTGE